MNFWPLPKAPGGRDQKNCDFACAIHVSNSHTKSGWIWREKKFGPPTAPPTPTPGAWPRRLNGNPVWYVLYLSFVRRHTKFGLKILEIDFVIEIKWYLTFWPLPRAPGGGNQRNCAVACAIDVSNSHTKSGWISEKKNFWPLNPPRFPQVRPLGHYPGDRMKIPSDMFYIFHLW